MSLPFSDNTGTDPGTVTRLLSELDAGDSTAFDKLFPLLYDELRRLAHRHRRRWSGDTTIGTTALVHEAYVKLTAGEVAAHTRVHFFRVASRAMRQILANYARDRRAAKRGGGAAHLPLDVLDHSGQVALDKGGAELLQSLDTSLTALETVHPRLSSVVECRFFGGLTVEETAAALNVSPATVKRDWTVARAWLYRDMTQGS